MTPHGLAAVGLGVQGRAVCSELVASGRFALAATYDPRQPADGGVARASAADACRAPGVDVVYVAAPPAAHEEVALAALAAGRAVLCEKPLAPDVAAAERMAAAADGAGARAGVNFWFATAPAGAGLLAGVRAGLLGEVRELSLVVRFARWPRAWQAGAGPWLVSRAEGGFVREVVSHFVYVADAIAGPGTLISHRVERGDDGLERRVTAELRHGDVRLSIDGAVAGDAEDANRLVVRGTRGEAAIIDWEVLEGLPPVADGTSGLAPALAALVEGRPGPLPGFATAARVVAAVESILA